MESSDSLKSFPVDEIAISDPSLSLTGGGGDPRGGGGGRKARVGPAAKMSLGSEGREKSRRKAKF